MGEWGMGTATIYRDANSAKNHQRAGICYWPFGVGRGAKGAGDSHY